MIIKLISFSWFDNVVPGVQSKLLSTSEMPGSNLANRGVDFKVKLSFVSCSKST